MLMLYKTAPTRPPVKGQSLPSPQELPWPMERVFQAERGTGPPLPRGSPVDNGIPMSCRGGPTAWTRAILWTAWYVP